MWHVARHWLDLAYSCQCTCINVSDPSQLSVPPRAFIIMLGPSGCGLGSDSMNLVMRPLLHADSLTASKAKLTTAPLVNTDPQQNNIATYTLTGYADHAAAQIFRHAK